MSRDLRPILRSPDGRLRAGWRILVPTLTIMIGLVVVDLVLVAAVTGLPAQLAAAGLGRFLLVLVVVTVTARLLDRRRVRDYGFRNDRGWWLDLAVGALIGLAIFGLSTGTAAAAGWVRITDTLAPAASGGLWLVLGMAIVRLAAVSLWEELVFRGVMITNAAEGFLGRWSRTTSVVVAASISTVVFAAIHVPQHLVLGQSLGRIPLMWLSLGAMLAIAYVQTGQLALPLGLHLTINLALQNVFVLDSEHADSAAALLQLEVVGPASLAGLGGWLQLAATAVGHALLLGWIRWRHGVLRVHPSLTARAEPATAEGCASPVRR